MKFIITATALALTAYPVLAESNLDKDHMVRTRDITSTKVHTTNSDGPMVWDSSMMSDAVDDNWDKIGEVDDIVLNGEGKMIGVPADDKSLSIITGLSKDKLMQQEDRDEGFWD
ncbi:hypothetical protein [uncultured Roseovarius sp.]|uniref:hypothetical protein n=1 Tax=uncultured Roseovarius sp. TaxID=293344 RepID=UPI002639154F|nr:hypothetical protein [uncultured Roseovarius sp.]